MTEKTYKRHCKKCATPDIYRGPHTCDDEYKPGPRAAKMPCGVDKWVLASAKADRILSAEAGKNLKDLMETPVSLEPSSRGVGRTGGPLPENPNAGAVKEAIASVGSSVLIEAHDIVSQRNDAYGEPTDTCERVAIAFSSLTGRDIKPADVALIQILFKIVRSEHGYKRDNNVDLAGYTEIRERCQVKEETNG